MGIASAAGYAAAVLFVRSDNTPGDLTRFLAIFLSLSALWGLSLLLARRHPPSLKLILPFAILFRVLLLPAGFSFDTHTYQRLLLYDNDVWRYLWEGHVWSAGVNPMKTPPAELEEYDLELRDPALYRQLYADRQWGEVFDNISYREFPSPYPHLAQLAFRLAHWLRPASVLTWKLIVMLFDLAAILLLARLAGQHPAAPLAVLAYGWNPLVIKEFSGSGHMDSILVFLVLAAVSLPAAWGSVCLAAASWVKPVPLLLAPALYRRGGWKALIAPAGAVALYLFFPPAGLQVYAENWTFNPALYRLIPLPRPWAMAVSGMILGGVVLYWFRKDDGSAEALRSQCLWLFGAFLLLTPMFAPWYLSWLLPFAALEGAIFWLALSGSVFLSYHAYLDFTENLVLVALEFAIPVLIWLLWGRRLRTKLT